MCPGVHTHWPLTQLPPFWHWRLLWHTSFTTSQRSPAGSHAIWWVVQLKVFVRNPGQIWILFSLTFESILTEALVLILSSPHAVTAVQAGPAVARAVVHALGDRSAFCETVGQIHLLVVDGNLSRQCRQVEATAYRKKTFTLLLIFFFSAYRSHLSYTSLKHFGDVGRLRQDVHVGDSSQVHGGVDIEALGFSWRHLPLHWALVDFKVASSLVPLGHNSVPLA